MSVVVEHRILFVEQIPRSRAEALSGFSLLTASSAEEALSRFRENNREVSLLLAEVRFAKSSGIHVASVLRSEVPALPVVLTSEGDMSSWRVDDLVSFARLGPDSVTVFQKPVETELLVNTVAKLIGAEQDPTTGAVKL
jgi:CheY-like chemotaxis protein